MNKKLLIFDTHPVQYRVPIWQAIEKIKPAIIHVVYATDCSVKGYQDNGFGQRLAWDEPLLEGYSYSILNCEKGEPFTGWGSLTGTGVKEIIAQQEPSAILLTGLNYKFDFIVYKEALKRGIPLWLRTESQDEAFHRSTLKSALRSYFYKLAYFKVNKFFYIGKLNRDHYLKHGAAQNKLKAAHYCTIDRFNHIEPITKEALRQQSRRKVGIDQSKFVLGFSGKFINKKNPDILYQLLEFLPDKTLERITLYFIGSGELEATLKELAQDAFSRYGVKSHFAGFVNQTKLVDHYLAIDALILPSRRMGETWGLVANEAMQAGCSVVVSDAVGCSVDFNNWEKFRVFNEGNAKQLAQKVEELSKYTRDYEWAKEKLNSYSIDAAARSLISEIH